MPAFDFDPNASTFSLKNARFLAAACAVSYESPTNCKAWAAANGLDESCDFFSAKGTQGFVARNNQIVLVTFRGTQPNKAIDWFSDVNLRPVKWDHAAGRVHQGFYLALKAIWDNPLATNTAAVLPGRLVDRGARTVWITGHSLGGALAKLCAAQAYFVDHIPLQGLYTFGQPRVGNQDFAEAFQAAIGPRFFHLVNDRDIVPRVPFYGLGFRHCGGEIFFDSKKKMTDRGALLETLPTALRLALLGTQFNALREASKMASDAVKNGGFPGNLLEKINELMNNRENAVLGASKALLERGTENIADHNIRKSYEAVLKA